MSSIAMNKTLGGVLLWLAWSAGVPITGSKIAMLLKIAFS
jgi:hypothetical protein